MFRPRNIGQALAHDQTANERHQAGPPCMPERVHWLCDDITGTSGCLKRGLPCTRAHTRFRCRFTLVGVRVWHTGPGPGPSPGPGPGPTETLATCNPSTWWSTQALTRCSGRVWVDEWRLDACPGHPSNPHAPLTLPYYLFPLHVAHLKLCCPVQQLQRRARAPARAGRAPKFSITPQ